MPSKEAAKITLKMIMSLMLIGLKMRDENPVTFPIKKRINTLLFIDRRAELYIQIWDHNFLAKWKRVKMSAPKTNKRWE